MHTQPTDDDDDVEMTSEAAIKAAKQYIKAQLEQQQRQQQQTGDASLDPVRPNAAMAHTSYDGARPLPVRPTALPPPSVGSAKHHHYPYPPPSDTGEFVEHPVPINGYGSVMSLATTTRQTAPLGLAGSYVTQVPSAIGSSSTMSFNAPRPMATRPVDPLASSSAPNLEYELPIDHDFLRFRAQIEALHLPKPGVPPPPTQKELEDHKRMGAGLDLGDSSESDNSDSDSDSDTQSRRIEKTLQQLERLTRLRNAHRPAPPGLARDTVANLAALTDDPDALHFLESHRAQKLQLAQAMEALAIKA